MKLRDWLDRCKLSVVQFAGIIKVDRSYVHKWMRGEYVPSKKIMDRIRDVTLEKVFVFDDLVTKKRKTGENGTSTRRADSI